MHRKKKLIVIEQYLSWQGHYKQYFENLVSENYSYVYCSAEKNKYPNSIFISASHENKDNFINFVKGRFINSFRAYKKMIELQPEIAHLIEFEPFSFLYLITFNRPKIPLLIITVHSIERMRYANKVKDLISVIQRNVYQYTLRRASSMGATFVTHYKHHQEQLGILLDQKYKNSIHVINYPCPEGLPSVLNKIHSRNRLLIYGQIREDKGIYEFLLKHETEELDITIAGKIRDERILKFNRPNLKIIDKFISDEELSNLINSHSFMLLPYQENYTGGAGTLKDSLSHGLPVIASDIPIFREVIQQEHVGLIFKTISDIKAFSNKITQEEYHDLQRNCQIYAKKYNWNYMKREYFKLYDNILAKV